MNSNGRTSLIRPILHLSFAFGLLICASPSAHANELTPVDSTKLTQQGVASFKRGDYNNAIRYLTARARMRPEDAEVYYYLGNCYLQLKQNDQAAHMFSASVRVAPASQAGKYSLTALETLSTLPKTEAPAPPPKAEGPDPGQTAASKDSLMSDKALDKAFNEAVVRIRGMRQTFKAKVDHHWLLMQEDMQNLTAKGNPNYATDLEKLQREAENKIQELQTKELRLENRIMAPDKIDVRAIPQLPAEKIDDSKTALGSLLDYFKTETPFDPFATDVTPELTSKFLTVKDVFGELPTYQGSARRLAKQVFLQIKSGIETKQDILDQQLAMLKTNLIHDVINIKINFGSSKMNLKNQQYDPLTYIAAAKVPRANKDQLSPMDQEIQQVIERSKKRIQEMEDTYYREADLIIAGGKEKLGGMIAQTGQMNSQLQKPSGNIQLVPQGTDMYTRNYINFGDRSDNKIIVKQTSVKLRPETTPLPLSAGTAKKITPTDKKPNGAK